MLTISKASSAFLGVFYLIFLTSVFAAFEPTEDIADKRRGYWERRYTISPDISFSKSSKLEEERAKRFSPYSHEQLPLEEAHYIYFGAGGDKQTTLMKHVDMPSTMAVHFYAPNPEGKSHYLIEDKSYSPSCRPLRHKSCFAWTQIKSFDKGDRNTYPIYTYQAVRGFSMDRGHGIDFILTVPELDHSSIDPRNFTPQNSDYNQQVRRLLVDKIRKKGGSFLEIPLYTSCPDIVKHKIPKKYSSTGNVEVYPIDVPVSFVFIEMLPTAKRKLFHFPNFIDYSELKERKNLASYLHLADLFEMQEEEITSPLLEFPFPDPYNLPDERKEASLSFFKANIYDPLLTEEEINQGIHERCQRANRLLSGRTQIAYKDPEAQNIIPLEAQEALIKTIAHRDLNQMAENEFSTLEYKLWRAFLGFNEFKNLKKGEDFKMLPLEPGLDTLQPARQWFKRALDQAHFDSTLSEKLDLLSFFTTYQHFLEGLVDPQQLLQTIKQQALETSTLREKWRLIALFVEEKDKREWLLEIEKQIEGSLAQGLKDQLFYLLGEKLNLVDYYYVQPGIGDDFKKSVQLFKEIRKISSTFVTAKYFARFKRG